MLNKISFFKNEKFFKKCSFMVYLYFYFFIQIFSFIFYNNVNGIILVHDLTNSKSLHNLGKWLNDVLSSEAASGLASIRIGASNPSRYVQSRYGPDDINIRHFKHLEPLPSDTSQTCTTLPSTLA